MTTKDLIVRLYSFGVIEDRRMKVINQFIRWLKTITIKVLLFSPILIPRNPISLFAGPMCPVLDPAMVTTVNFFHGNEFYTARRAKLAWLLLARH